MKGLTQERDHVLALFVKRAAVSLLVCGSTNLLTVARSLLAPAMVNNVEERIGWSTY